MDDASAHPWDAQRLKHQKVWAEAVASFVNLQCETRRPFITVCCNGMPPEAQPPSMAQHHLEVNVFHGSGYNCLRQEEAGGGPPGSNKKRCCLWVRQRLPEAVILFRSPLLASGRGQEHSVKALVARRCEPANLAPPSTTIGVPGVPSTTVPQGRSLGDAHNPTHLHTCAHAPHICTCSTHVAFAGLRPDGLKA